MKKYHIYILSVLAFISAVGLGSCHDRYTVGLVNFKEMKSSMQPFAEKAYAFPSQPGTQKMLILQDDKLVASNTGPTYFRTGRVILYHEQSGNKFVYFDTGGGHLGTQGYIYAQNSDTKEVLRVVFGDHEGYLVRRVDEHWFLYDSLEE